jgi:hypothetical protein
LENGEGGTATKRWGIYDLKLKLLTRLGDLNQNLGLSNQERKK